MIVGNLRVGTTTNDLFVEEGKHFVTIHMIGDWVSGEPTVLEPDKFARFGWFTLDTLPSPLFLPIINVDKELLRSLL